MAIDTVIHTNRHSLDRVLKAGVPVLLVFWRRDAAPSLALDPALDRLAARFAGKALVAKIDAGEETELVSRYQVTQLPTLLFFLGGSLEAAAVGAAGEDALAAWLRALVDGGQRPPLPTGPAVTLGTGTPPSQTYTNGRAGHGKGEPVPRRGDAPVTLSDANFDEVIGGPDPVLVDFWAPWCGPCRMVAPAVEQLAREFSGRAVVGKLDVDENPATAGRYRIMSIPTLAIFRHGQMVDQIVGAQPLPVLRQRLERQIGQPGS